MHIWQRISSEIWTMVSIADFNILLLVSTYYPYSRDETVRVSLTSINAISMAINEQNSSIERIVRKFMENSMSGCLLTYGMHTLNNVISFPWEALQNSATFAIPAFSFYFDQYFWLTGLNNFKARQIYRESKCKF